MPFFPRSTIHFGLFAMVGFWFVQASRGQTTDPAPTAAAAEVPLRLDLSRRDLKNFLTDEEALEPYQVTDGSVADLHDVFALGSVKTPWAVFWDSRSCRLLGILDLEAPPEQPKPVSAEAETDDSEEEEPGDEPPPPSPYRFKASGPFPLANTGGVSGAPRYFGFRLVKDVPEFLYSCGTVSIEERLWIDEGGRVLRQRFAATGAEKGLRITVPDDWKDRVTASVGTWKGNLLSVPKENSAEVILSYPLVSPAAEGSQTATPATN